MKLEPLNPKAFIEQIKKPTTVSVEVLLSVFEKDIENLKNYISMPFFWFVPDNCLGRIVAASDQIGDHTPYQKNEWLTASVPEQMLADIFHHHDRDFFFAASNLIMQKAALFTDLAAAIYIRVKNKIGNYRWMIIQTPRYYFNQEGECLSLLAVFADLGHLNLDMEPILTIKYTGTDKIENFEIYQIDQKLEFPAVVKLTKREKEILSLIARGYSSHKIAESLFISYHTVENHKKNIKLKTNCHKLTELVSFALHLKSQKN